MADSHKGSKRDKEQHEKARPPKGRMHPGLYVFSVAILIIIVVTFIGAPLVSRISGNSRGLVFGSYDGQEIKYYPGNYLSRQKDAIAERVGNSGNDTNMQWVAYQVWRAAFQNTVIHTAILKAAETSGVRITDEAIDKALTSYSGYQGNGKFSAALYRDTPNSERASIRKYYREELISSQYRNDLLYGTEVASTEKDFIQNMASPERSFIFQRISYDQYPADLVWNYGKEHADLFRKINVSRITIQNSEENAKSVHQQLASDPTLFDEVARTQSKDGYAESGGYIGWQYFYSLSNELESEDNAQAIIDLKPGEISKVISTKFGWVIYKCNEAAAPAQEGNADDIKTIRQYMERFERGTIEDYLVKKGNALKTQAAKSGLANAAAEGWESGETASFPLNYGGIEIFKPIKDASGSGKLQSAATNEPLLTALFSIKKGEITDPMILDDNVYLFEVKEITTPDQNTLDSIGAYYSYIAQQYTNTDLRTTVLNSDKLEDNFDAVFSKYFLNTTQK